jgi:metal-responsive CopG/Arc/MetJ family transcriptional regulator
MTAVHKLSVSLDVGALAFLDQYRQRHQVGSRSKVVSIAMQALAAREQELTLEQAYAASAASDAAMNAEFSATANDGLTHEAW